MWRLTSDLRHLEVSLESLEFINKKNLLKMFKQGSRVPRSWKVFKNVHCIDTVKLWF